MKRFVTYIYEYDRGARGRNVGFVRTDIRNDGCRMDLHIRGLNCPKAKATIYFVIANAPVIGIPVAEMIISQGAGQAKLMCPQGNIGSSGYHTDQIDAIVIRYHSGQILVSSFVPEPDEEVLHGNFRMWDELEPDTPAASENTPPPAPDETTSPMRDENTHTPPTQPNPVTDVQRNPSVPTPESIENTSPVEILPDTPPNHTTAAETKAPAPDTASDTEDLHREDPVPKETMPDETMTEKTMPKKVMTQGSTSEDTMSKETVSEETAPEETVTRKRIEITGIRDLPRANWYLCNNSFLVHGFFNYHYLLLKTVETGDKKRLFLGVPGIYEQPERVMALIFGFSEFEPEASEEPCCKTGSSGDRTGTFGYWMCELLP